MLERLKFARYAIAFERAYRTDGWDGVRDCFHRDATYTIEGSATEIDGETRGRDAIVALFKRTLDRFDRKFDRRKPGIVGFPRVADGELTMKWRALYILGHEKVMLNGTTRCRFDGLRIHRLHDTMIADECTRWAALADSATSR